METGKEVITIMADMINVENGYLTLHRGGGVIAVFAPDGWSNIRVAE